MALLGQYDIFVFRILSLIAGLHQLSIYFHFRFVPLIGRVLLPRRSTNLSSSFGRNRLHVQSWSRRPTRYDISDVVSLIFLSRNGGDGFSFNKFIFIFQFSYIGDLQFKDEFVKYAGLVWRIVFRIL